jgi:hypothetical protein
MALDPQIAGATRASVAMVFGGAIKLSKKRGDFC